MDFNSIGDHEAFKNDVAKDVAAAAKIAAKHIKVTGLRAGSVIVDMLIAKEAGDVKAIVQDLEEQVKSPNSLLKQGKLTSKIKDARPPAPVVINAIILPPPADAVAPGNITSKKRTLKSVTKSLGDAYITHSL